MSWTKQIRAQNQKYVRLKLHLYVVWLCFFKINLCERKGCMLNEFKTRKSVWHLCELKESCVLNWRSRWTKKISNLCGETILCGEASQSEKKRSKERKKIGNNSDLYDLCRLVLYKRKGPIWRYGVSCSFFSLYKGGCWVIFVASCGGDGYAGEESSGYEFWLKKEEKGKKKTAKMMMK